MEVFGPFKDNGQGGAAVELDGFDPGGGLFPTFPSDFRRLGCVSCCRKKQLPQKHITYKNLSHSVSALAQDYSCLIRYDILSYVFKNKKNRGIFHSSDCVYRIKLL
jgi:hypothetical protein